MRKIYIRKSAEYTSTYPGVSWSKRNKAWRATIQKKGKQVNIGYFKNEKDAAYAYEKAESEL